MDLVTDASTYGLGAVLLQWEGEDAGWLPVAFASRKQKGAEAKYSVTEKECLAVLFGLQKFRQHLYGERIGVVTDHSALVWLISLRDPKLSGKVGPTQSTQPRTVDAKKGDVIDILCRDNKAEGM
jgi:hypothetical protein